MVGLCSVVWVTVGSNFARRFYPKVSKGPSGFDVGGQGMLSMAREFSSSSKSPKPQTLKLDPEITPDPYPESLQTKFHIRTRWTAKPACVQRVSSM